jgi:hypothetical protein
VIAFTARVSIVTAVVAGVAPAVRGSRGDLNAAMTTADGRSTQGPRRRRLEAGLVALASLAGRGAARRLRTADANRRCPDEKSIQASIPTTS